MKLLKYFLLIIVCLLLFTAIGCGGSGDTQQAPQDGETYEYGHVLQYTNAEVTYYPDSDTVFYYYTDHYSYYGGSVSLSTYFKYEPAGRYRYHDNGITISGNWTVEPID